MSTDLTGKKAIIMGTAPSWKLAPWGDKDAVVMGLNDAYLLGFPRYDVWYDLHPFEKFAYKPDGAKKINALDLPVGSFVRPKGHIQWLAKQRVPVYVQKADPRVPHALVFPKAEIEEKFGRHFDSTPAWMVAHAILLGFKEIQVYGIHLATEMEYLKQRPGFEFILGVAVGMGVKIVMPRESPVLRSSHEYAFEPDPALPVMAAQREGERIKAEREATERAWKASRTWWRPQGDPVLRSRRAWLAAQATDASHAVQWETFKKRALVG
jgi:hypothetical protein